MWIRAIIPIKLFKNEVQIYKFLDDFIKYCDDYKWCQTFHFFIENGINIDDSLEIRMECDDSQNIGYPTREGKYESDFSAWINQWLNNMGLTKLGDFNSLCRDIKVSTDYSDEIYNYGDDGWDIAKKIFEYTCRAAVHIKTGRAKNLFRETKFIHCFLNQCFYDSLKESAFHSNSAWQMMVKHLRERQKEKHDRK